MTLFKLILTLSAAVAFTFTTSNGQAAQLEWNTHYGDAKRTAQAAKRPLIVVIENSIEKRIDENTIDEESRTQVTNQAFELVRVDANTDYGKRVAKAFGVHQYPYTAVTDNASERIVFRKSGQMTRADWTLALAKSSSASPAVERVVVQRPVIEQPIERPIVAAPYSTPPVYPMHNNAPQLDHSIQPAYQPVMQMIAPSGLYQMPASQCVT